MLAQSSLAGVAVVAKATNVRAKRDVRVRAANKYADELLETAVRATTTTTATRSRWGEARVGGNARARRRADDGPGGGIEWGEMCCLGCVLRGRR